MFWAISLVLLVAAIVTAILGHSVIAGICAFTVVAVAMAGVLFEAIQAERKHEQLTTESSGSDNPNS